MSPVPAGRDDLRSGSGVALRLAPAIGFAVLVILAASLQPGSTRASPGDAGPGAATLAERDRQEEPSSQERPDPALPEGGLEWPTPWITEIPTVDLSGSWRFDPERSDPMVEAWRGIEILYRIEQQPDHIVLEFLPEGEEGANIQVYRWDGTLRRDRRGRTEIAERARWTDGGRVLEVHGRSWIPGIEEEPYRYHFRYSLRRGTLTFTQADDSGATTWRFVDAVEQGGGRRTADDQGPRSGDGGSRRRPGKAAGCHRSTAVSANVRT